MVLANLKYDASIINSDSVELGLTFLRGKDGKPYYQERGDPALANQFMVGEGDYAHLPPEKELQIYGDDYREGFGLLFYSPDEPKRYRDSFGVDARFRGHLLPGPLPTTVTKFPSVTAPTVQNAGFETSTTGTLCDDWQDQGAVNESAAKKHGGTYSGYILDGVTGLQNLTWSATYQGKTFIFSCWARASDAGSCRIGIFDGKTTSYSFYHTGGSGWEQLIVGKTFASDANAFSLSLVNGAAGEAGEYFDDATVTMPDTVTSVFCEFNDKLYIGTGAYLGKLNAAGTSFDMVFVLPNTITDLEVFTDDCLYIAQGHGNNPWYMTTAEAFTETSQASNDAVFFKTLGTTLWKADTPRELRSATEPKAGAWSDAINVGSTAEDITGLNTAYIGGRERLIIHKEESTYYLDDDSNPINLMPILRTSKTATGGKGSIEWQGNLYLPYGAQLFEYANGLPTELSPGIFTTNSSDFDGDVQALSADSNYLFCAVDNGAKIEIGAGGWEIIDGYGPDWRWHFALAEITLTGANTMYVSTVVAKRLWIGSTSASDSIYYINLPTGYGNVGADTNLTFQSGGYLITPWQYANLKGDPKAWIKLILNVSDVDATNYWSAHYQIWGDTTWTSIGTFGADGSTSQTRYIPDDSSGNNPQSPMIRFKFTCTSDGAAPAPHLLSWDCRGIWYPASKRKLIEMMVLCKDEIIAKNGKDLDQTEKIIRDFLNTAYDPTTKWPLTFNPPYYKTSSDAKRVKLIDPFEQELVYLGKEEGWSWVYKITMEEVTLS